MCKKLELQNRVLTDKEIKKHSWEWVAKFHYGIIKKKKKKKKKRYRLRMLETIWTQNMRIKVWDSTKILSTMLTWKNDGWYTSGTQISWKDHKEGEASVFIAAWMEAGRTWTLGVCMWIVSAGPFLLGLASWVTGSCFSRNDTPLLKPSLTTLSENKTKEKTNNKKTPKNPEDKTATTTRKSKPCQLLQ